MKMSGRGMHKMTSAQNSGSLRMPNYRKPSNVVSKNNPTPQFAHRVFKFL